MPLLKSIVEELDRELDRLQALRKIIASLDSTSAPVRLCTEAASISALATNVPAHTCETTKPRRNTRIDAGRRRGPRSLRRTEEPRALAKTVPGGPVVFYPERSLQSQAAKAVLASAEQDRVAAAVDLNAEGRKLAALWTAAPAF